MQDAAVAPDGEDVFEDEGEEEGAAQGQKDVVEEEDGLEDAALACRGAGAHECLQTKDEAEVEDGGGDD